MRLPPFCILYRTPKIALVTLGRRMNNIAEHRVRAMGIRDHPTAPRSPWQNGHVERLIGSIRRECLDHVIVFGEADLRRILKTYASYYNRIRTHLSLDKDAPAFRRERLVGSVAGIPLFGGLHHRYVRV